MCAVLVSCRPDDTRPISASISYRYDLTRYPQQNIRLKLVNNSDDNLFIPYFRVSWKLTKDGVDFTDDYYNMPDSSIEVLMDPLYVRENDDERLHIEESIRLRNLLIDEELKRAGIDSLSLSYRDIRSSYFVPSLNYLLTIIPARDSMIVYLPIYKLFRDGNPTANYKIWFDFPQEPDVEKKKAYTYDGSTSVTFWPLKQIDNYKAYFGKITCTDTIYLNP